MNTDEQSAEEAMRIAIARHLGIEPLRRWRVFYDKERQHYSDRLVRREDALENRAKEIAGDLRCGFINNECSEPEEYDEWQFAPYYTVDPAAALLLVEHMRNEGLYFRIESHLPEGYRAKFWLNFRIHEATAPTFPLAIAKAFISANQIEIQP